NRLRLHRAGRTKRPAPHPPPTAAPGPSGVSPPAPAGRRPALVGCTHAECSPVAARQVRRRPHHRRPKPDKAAPRRPRRHPLADGGGGRPGLFADDGGDHHPHLADGGSRRDAAQHLPAPRGARDGGDAVVRGEAGDQTDQESRSAGHRAAARVTAMDITIHASLLPHNDPDASLAFYRDTLGFEVRNDVGYGGMRWITGGPPDPPATAIVLEPPAVDPGVTDDERRTIAEMMAKGSYARIILATADLEGVFARLQASGADVAQEPTEQPYGVRDCAFRHPAGNLIRIN